MRHIFLDTNVLIDFLANRPPFSLESAKLFNYSFKKFVKIYVSAVSYNNLYYIIRRSTGHDSTIKMLNELQAWTETVEVTREVIHSSLISDFHDFEDAIQYHSAKRVAKIECLVTRDTKDYRLSSLPVMTPIEALTMIENTGR